MLPITIPEEHPLGRDLEIDPDEKYTDIPGDLDCIIQNAIPGREGLHMDIETDDVDAGVERLENLGTIKRNKVGNARPGRTPVVRSPGTK